MGWISREAPNLPHELRNLVIFNNCFAGSGSDAGRKRPVGPPCTTSQIRLGVALNAFAIGNGDGSALLHGAPDQHGKGNVWQGYACAVRPVIIIAGQVGVAEWRSL